VRRTRGLGPPAPWPQLGELLTAILGTALVNKLLGLIVVAVLIAYFYYCGIIEERNLTVTFPQSYPEYKSRTKMLIPFLL
jgi:protein-S-isoprenylcysteine O-methyltransferase Ste14